MSVCHNGRLERSIKTKPKISSIKLYFHSNNLRLNAETAHDLSVLVDQLQLDVDANRRVGLFHGQPKLVPGLFLLRKGTARIFEPLAGVLTIGRQFERNGDAQGRGQHNRSQLAHLGQGRKVYVGYGILAADQLAGHLGATLDVHPGWEGATGFT